MQRERRRVPEWLRLKEMTSTSRAKKLIREFSQPASIDLRVEHRKRDHQLVSKRTLMSPTINPKYSLKFNKSTSHPREFSHQPIQRKRYCRSDRRPVMRCELLSLKSSETTRYLRLRNTISNSART